MVIELLGGLPRCRSPAVAKVVLCNFESEIDE